MGTISIKMPIKIEGSFRIKDSKSARKLIKELNEVAERVDPLDEVFGIWKDQPERVEEVDGFRKRSRAL